MISRGTVSQGTGLTLYRLLERLFDEQAEGQLELTPANGGTPATLTLGQGQILHSVRGELNGEAALNDVRAEAGGWEFAFHPASATPEPAEQKMPSISLLRPRPASSFSASERDMDNDQPRRVRAMPEQAPRVAPGKVLSLRSEPQSGAVPAAEAVSAPAPVLRDAAPTSPVPAVPPAGVSLTPRRTVGLTLDRAEEFVAAGRWDSSRHRLARVDGTWINVTEPADQAYHETDQAFLLYQAETAGAALGFTAPSVMAIAETDRSTGYHAFPEGILGLIGAAGSPLETVIEF